MSVKNGSPRRLVEDLARAIGVRTIQFEVALLLHKRRGGCPRLNPDYKG